MIREAMIKLVGLGTATYAITFGLFLKLLISGGGSWAAVGVVFSLVLFIYYTWEIVDFVEELF